MFETTYSCKKCPSAIKSEEIQLCKSSSTSETSKETTLETTIAQSRKPFPTEDQSQNTAYYENDIFLGSSLDDQSIPELKRVHPKSAILLPLLLVHVLSHTPGIAPAPDSFSEFVITNHEISAKAAPLRINNNALFLPFTKG